MTRSFVPSVKRGLFACVVLALAVGLVVTRAHAADAGTEREVAALQRKAVQEDFLNLDYPAAIKKLQSAVARCGADRCGTSVRGSLLRDLGAMQILGGAVEEGKANLTLAVAADSSLELDPAYKNPQLDAVWAAAKGVVARAAPESAAPAPDAGAGAGVGGAAEAGGRGALPSGDFAHTPVPEQAVRTPVPIYAEYGGSETLKRVIVKYKAAGMSEWAPIDLPRLGDGWGGLIPCKDVTEGQLQYFLQGFNAEDDPVATSGGRNAPYTVPIRRTIAGPAPALPGKDPPAQCGELVGVECPPNFPGCANKKKAEGEECERSEECEGGACTDGKCQGAEATERYRKMWGGVGLAMDLLLAPGDDDVCALNSAGNAALTPGNPYLCYDPTLKANFPGSGALNASIDKDSTTRLDYVNGGFARGPLTLLASIDYALSANILIGARAGYELLTYPGGNPGPAFPPVRLEARLTYLLGADAINQSFAPVFFGGVGVGEFDGYIPVKVTLLQPPLGAGYSPGVVQQDAWLTAGPMYAAAGAGVRVAFGGEIKNVAVTGIFKLEGAFGGTSGFLFGIAPELGIQYGF